MLKSAAPRLAAIVLLSGCGVVFGAAAGMGVTSDRLGAAAVTIPRCTTAGLTVFQNLSGSTVVSVTVGGIPASCAGGLLQVTVDNGTVSGSGSATVPAGGGSVTVTLSAAPGVTTAARTDIVLVGP